MSRSDADAKNSLERALSTGREDGDSQDRLLRGRLRIRRAHPARFVARDKGRVARLRRRGYL